MKDNSLCFPLMLALLVLISVLLGIVGPLQPGFAAWVNKWQNLIAAVIAMFAAWLAYQSALKQLEQNKQQEHNRRHRKHTSVRAMLPLALSHIMEYAEQSVHKLNALLPQCEGEVLPSNVATQDLMQLVPRETLQVLAEFIESADDIDTALVEDMVAWIQIHDSRVRSLVHRSERNSLVLRSNIEGSMVDAASVGASAVALFEYARRRDQQLPTNISWANVRGAFFSMSVWLDQNDRLDATITSREKSSNGPFDGLREPQPSNA